MTVAPSGHLSLSFDYALATLAASSTFQTWTASATAAAAKAKIAVGVTETIEYPVAILTPYPEELGEQIGFGDAPTFKHSGTFFLMLMDEITEADPRDAFYAFRNNIGNVWKEMEAIAGTAGYLSIHSISVMREQRRSSLEQEARENKRFDIILQIDWGP